MHDTCLTATGTHVPYGITQYYLPPGRGDIPAFTRAEAGTRLMCILLCSIFNEDTVSFMYLCNDRELIIMNSRLLYDDNKLLLLVNEL